MQNLRRYNARPLRNLQRHRPSDLPDLPWNESRLCLLEPRSNTGHSLDRRYYLKKWKHRFGSHRFAQRRLHSGQNGQRKAQQNTARGACRFVRDKKITTEEISTGDGATASRMVNGSEG